MSATTTSASSSTSVSTPTPLSSSVNQEQRSLIIQKDERGFGLKVSGSNPVQVASVTEGGPAHRAGVRSGDKIVQINGTNVFNSGHCEVVKALKDAGPRVVLIVITSAPSATSNSQENLVTRSSSPLTTGLDPVSVSSTTNLLDKNSPPSSPSCDRSKLVRGKRTFIPRNIFHSPRSHATSLNFSSKHPHLQQMSSSTTHLLNSLSMDSADEDDSRDAESTKDVEGTDETLSTNSTGLKKNGSKSKKKLKKFKKPFEELDISDVEELIKSLLSHKQVLSSCFSGSNAPSRTFSISGSTSTKEQELMKESKKLLFIVSFALSLMRTDIDYFLFYALATLLQWKLSMNTSTSGQQKEKTGTKEAFFELISIFLLPDSPLALTELPSYLTSQNQLHLLTKLFSVPSNDPHTDDPCQLNDLLTSYINCARKFVNERLIRPFHTARGMLCRSVFSFISSKKKLGEFMGRLLTSTLQFLTSDDANLPPDANFFSQSESSISCLKGLLEGQPLKGDQTDIVPYSTTLARLLCLLSTFYHFLPHSIFPPFSSAIHSQLESFILLTTLVPSKSKGCTSFKKIDFDCNLTGTQKPTGHLVASPAFVTLSSVSYCSACGHLLWGRTNYLLACSRCNVECHHWCYFTIIKQNVSSYPCLPIDGSNAQFASSTTCSFGHQTRDHLSTSRLSFSLPGLSKIFKSNQNKDTSSCCSPELGQYSQKNPLFSLISSSSSSSSHASSSSPTETESESDLEDEDDYEGNLSDPSIPILKSKSRKGKKARRIKSLTDEVAISIDALADASDENGVTESKEQTVGDELTRAKDKIRKKLRQRKLKTLELIRTEKSFGKKLLLLHDLFYVQIVRSPGLLTKDEMNILFSNHLQLMDLHRKLYGQLRKRLKPCLDVKRAKIDWKCVANLIEEIFTEIGPDLEEQVALYCSNFVASNKLLKSKTRTSKLFSLLLVEAESAGPLKKLKFSDLLAAPVQRIMRYPLLVAEIRSTFDSQLVDSSDEEFGKKEDEAKSAFDSALTVIRAIVDGVNRRKSEFEFISWFKSLPSAQNSNTI